MLQSKVPFIGEGCLCARTDRSLVSLWSRDSFPQRPSPRQPFAPRFRWRARTHHWHPAARSPSTLTVLLGKGMALAFLDLPSPADFCNDFIDTRSHLSRTTGPHLSCAPTFDGAQLLSQRVLIQDDIETWQARSKPTRDVHHPIAPPFADDRTTH